MCRQSRIAAVMCLLLAITLWGCPKRPEVVQAPPTPAGPTASVPAPPTPAPQVPAPPIMQEPAKVAEITVTELYFDFDQSNIKNALQAAGIAAERVSIISFGKERPFVLGHDESAWKWNRRAHMVIETTARQ